MLVSSRQTQTLEASPFKIHGIDVNDYKLVGLKSAVHFRAGYRDIASRIIPIDARESLFSIEKEGKDSQFSTERYPIDSLLPGLADADRCGLQLGFRRHGRRLSSGSGRRGRCGARIWRRRWCICGAMWLWLRCDIDNAITRYHSNTAGGTERWSPPLRPSAGAPSTRTTKVLARPRCLPAPPSVSAPPAPGWDPTHTRPSHRPPPTLKPRMGRSRAAYPAATAQPCHYSARPPPALPRVVDIPSASV